jgi:RNA polymerase primary sigma factor
MARAVERSRIPAGAAESPRLTEDSRAINSSKSTRKHSERRTAAVRGDSLAKYLQEIRAYPLLSRAEEAALARRIRRGDAAALGRLVCANLRFVVSIAKRYQKLGVSLADLVDEGNLGLIRAAEKFDEAKGAKFISYAVWWIRQAILQALAEQGHTVRVPLSRANMLHNLGRQANALRQELGREPTQQEIAAGLDVTEKEIACAVPVARSYLSLDAPIAGREDAKLLDYLRDDVTPAPDNELVDGGLSEVLEKALARLRGREAKVLRLYFGFDGNEPMTLESIGASMGITRERVRQIKERGLARLRSLEKAHVLTAFRDYEVR